MDMFNAEAERSKSTDEAKRINDRNLVIRSQMIEASSKAGIELVGETLQAMEGLAVGVLERGEQANVGDAIQITVQHVVESQHRVREALASHATSAAMMHCATISMWLAPLP